MIVAGAGLIGVSTAYALHRRGHEVIVVERHGDPGLETSFANGALLTPGMSDPWNAPGSWRILLSSLMGPNAALRVSWGALPSLLGWGVSFIRNSSPDRYSRNTQSNLRLSLYSLQCMKELRQATPIEYGHSAEGILKIFRDAKALERTIAVAD